MVSLFTALAGMTFYRKMGYFVTKEETDSTSFVSHPMDVLSTKSEEGIQRIKGFSQGNKNE